MYKNYNRSVNTRCSICNRVSAIEIETEVGDFTKQSFVPDPKSSLHFICEDCKEIHENLMYEYERDDLIDYLTK